jgi:hypothetical protein
MRPPAPDRTADDEFRRLMMVPVLPEHDAVLLTTSAPFIATHSCGTARDAAVLATDRCQRPESIPPTF